MYKHQALIVTITDDVGTTCNMMYKHQALIVTITDDVATTCNMMQNWYKPTDIYTYRHCVQQSWAITNFFSLNFNFN